MLAAIARSSPMSAPSEPMYPSAQAANCSCVGSA